MLFDGKFSTLWKPGEKRQNKFVFIGTQFTCFTGTKVQTLTHKALRLLGRNLPVERLEKEFKECEAKELRFDIGTRVLANVGTWKAGTVIRHWDDGNAYRVDVDGVGNVWARFDDDDLIRPVEDA